MTDQKKCSICGAKKPIAEFWAKSISQGIYYSWCRDCNKTRKPDFRPRGGIKKGREFTPAMKDSLGYNGDYGMYL